MGALGVQVLMVIEAKSLSTAESQCPPAMPETPLHCFPAPGLFLGCVAIASLHETFPAAELEETLFLVVSFLLPAHLGSTAGHAWMCPWPAPSK